MKYIMVKTMVTDVPTEEEGMITHVRIGMADSHMYCFQPKGTTPEGTPRKRRWHEFGRFKIPRKGLVDDLNLPISLDVLGTQVRHTLTGIRGTAIALFVHQDGCVHIEIQPKGHGKDGEPVESHDFDYRNCTGRLLPKVEGPRKKDRSPTPMPRFNI